MQRHLHEHENEMQDFLEVVRADYPMLNDLQLCNMSASAYQKQKIRLEHGVDFIVQERVRNRSFAARWDQDADKSAFTTFTVYKLCMFIPIHGPSDCAGSSVLSRPPSTVDT